MKVVCLSDEMQVASGVRSVNRRVWDEKPLTKPHSVLEAGCAFTGLTDRCGESMTIYMGMGDPQKTTQMPKKLGILHIFLKVLRLYGNSICDALPFCLPLSREDFAQKRKSDQKWKHDVFLFP